MSFEQKINQKLNKYPNLKKKIKRAYQRFFYTISKKIKSEGLIEKITPNDNNDYFYGYYDKSPWDSSGRYILCMKAKDTSKNVSPNETLKILLIDTYENNKLIELTETNAWNVQMGCMAQWLGPAFDRFIIYNDYIYGRYVSIIMDVFSMEKRIINYPIYAVSSDGSFALSLDFSRLHTLRPGYGYHNVPDDTKGVNIPDMPCIYKIDLDKNVCEPLLKYSDFVNFNTNKEMLNCNAIHKVNHIMLSPNNKRFMVLHRWYLGETKYSRLITCDIDGKNMYILNDGMVSHCFWKDEDYIIAFEKKNQYGYYLMKDKTTKFTHLWPQYTNDGHPSYSPNKKYIVTDSYPNRVRIQEIKILEENKNEGKIVAKVYSPFKYDNETRCDLHPRWSRDGKKICFDGCFEGNRAMYIVEVNND